MTTKPLASDLVAVIDTNDTNFKKELRICKARAQGGMYFIRVYMIYDGKEIVTDLIGEVFTALTKDASCGRGDYADEIDVMISRGPGMAARAKRVAELAIKHHYVPGLKVSKVPAVVERGEGCANRTDDGAKTSQGTTAAGTGGHRRAGVANG